MNVNMPARLILSIAALALATLPTQAATNQFNVEAFSSQNYTINGVNDPELTLVRGFTYFFNITVAANHPFHIKTIAGTGTGNQYNDGVSAQGQTQATVTFTVPNTAPDTLFYQCSIHFNMTAPIHIVDAPAVEITHVEIGTNIMLQSTGTEELNLNVQARSSLTNAWAPAAIQSNIFVDGTNTTQVDLPASDAAFFQIQQGFFEIGIPTP